MESVRPGASLAEVEWLWHSETTAAEAMSAKTNVRVRAAIGRQPAPAHGVRHSRLTSLLRLRRMRRLASGARFRLDAHAFAHPQGEFLLPRLARLVSAHDPLHQRMAHHV